MTDVNLTLKSLDKRIRSSLAYTNWVARNKDNMCIQCSSTENLQCHHLIDLYHVILGLWKFYGDADQVFNHINIYHDTDMLEGVTLCSECHKKKHNGRVFDIQTVHINTDNWCVVPRNLKIIPNHSKRDFRPGTLGLVSYQALLGIGWYLLNDHIESRILTIHRRRFADLIGKKAGTSFNSSLEASLTQLEAIGVISGIHQAPNSNEVELHISQKYLEMCKENPWFVPLEDIKTDSMCVLCLRLFFGMQTLRKNYGISFGKLKKHLGITVQRRDSAIAAIQKAVDQINWLKMEDGEPMNFKISSRKPTPIRSLRAILTDVVDRQ